MNQSFGFDTCLVGVDLIDEVEVHLHELSLVLSSLRSEFLKLQVSQRVIILLAFLSHVIIHLFHRQLVRVRFVVRIISHDAVGELLLEFLGFQHPSNALNYARMLDDLLDVWSFRLFHLKHGSDQVL